MAEEAITIVVATTTVAAIIVAPVTAGVMTFIVAETTTVPVMTITAAGMITEAALTTAAAMADGIATTTVGPNVAGIVATFAEAGTTAGRAHVIAQQAAITIRAATARATGTLAYVCLPCFIPRLTTLTTQPTAWHHRHGVASGYALTRM